MEYLLGGCTGLLKEAETTNRSLLRLSLVSDQSLDKGVTSMCWSGGFGGYSEDEITVGYKDGSLISYNYLTMKINREYKLDSKCVYVTMLNHHFDLFTPQIYSKNKLSPLYPDSKRPNLYDTNDRLLLAVTESGYIYIFDWSVEKSECVAKVKYLSKDAHNSDNNEEYVGALLVYKYRGPVKDARVHSVMRNRLILGGTSNPPALIDLFSESVLWSGKFPHETVLGLQSSLNITSLCFMEEIDDDLICVATKDSFIYLYDPKSQKDPVFEFNICDYRSIGLSKKLLSLYHEDYNSKHRKRLSKAINEKYSQSDRAIVKLATMPSYKLIFTDPNSPTEPTETSGSAIHEENHTQTFKINDNVSIKYFNAVKKEFCNLYICDNFGTIYNLQFLTGDRLVWWIYRKIEPIVDLGDPPNSVNSSFEKHPNNVNNKASPVKMDKGSSDTNGIENSSDADFKHSNQSEIDEKTPRGGLKRQLNAEDVYKLNEADKHKIVQHLLEARKRLCSSSNNDKKIHFRKNHYSQFVCRILNCYNFHNGSVVDLMCIGDYLISAALDRYSNVVSLKTGKLLFNLYCNQKQSCILVKNKYLLSSFDDRVEFKNLQPNQPNEESTKDGSSETADESDEDSDADEVDDVPNSDLESEADSLGDQSHDYADDDESLDLDDDASFDDE